MFLEKTKKYIKFNFIIVIIIAFFSPICGVDETEGRSESSSSGGFKMESHINKYFKVLGIPKQLGTKLTPSVETLYFIVNKHVMAIPYQNFSIFLKNDIDLSIESIEKKLLDQNQGGICYETSELLFYNLESLGFKIKRVPAFLLNNKPFNPDIPSIHNVLIITINKKHFLVDVGYGYNSLRYPLEFTFEERQEINILQNENYQLIRSGEYYHLYMNIKNNWYSLYCFPTSLKSIDLKETNENCQTLLKLPNLIPIRDTYIKVSKLTNNGRIGFHYEPKNLIMHPYKLLITGVQEDRFEYPNSLILREEIQKEFGLEMPDELLRENDKL